MINNKLKKAGKEAAYNYSTVLLSQFLCMPLSILYISMVTRTLGPEEFGYFTIFLAVAQLFLCIFVNWTRSSIIRFGSEAFAKEKDMGEIIGSQFLITLISFILALIILFLIKSYLSDVLKLGEKSYLWVVLYFAAYILSDFILQFLQAIHRIRSYAAALFSRQAMLVIFFGLIFTVFKQEPYVSNVIIIEIVSYLFIVSLFSALAFSGTSLFKTFSINTQKIKEMLHYSWPIMIKVILGYSLLWADIWIIKFFLSYKAVGEYEVANRLIHWATNVIMPLGIIGFPLVVSFKSIENDSLIFTFATRIVPQLCFFWGSIILLLLLSSKTIIHILFGEGYRFSLIPFQVLLIGLSFQILPFLYNPILQAYDWTKKMAFITAIAVIINLSLDLILIPKWGIIGAAISKTCALIICSQLSAHFALKCLLVKKENYVVYGFLSIPFLAFLILYTLKQTFFFFLVMVVLYGLAILIVKKNSIFSRESWSFWEKIEMPFFVRFIFKKIYWVFV